MSDERSAFETSLHALAEEERQRLEAHPSPARLAAFQARELSPEAAEEIEEHLALCPSCARYFLDLQAFEEGRGEEERSPISRQMTAEDWVALQGRIAQEGGSMPATGDRMKRAPRAAPGPAATGESWYRSVPALRTLAAGLAVAVLALGSWTYLLVRESRRPRADVEVVDLQPSGERSAVGGEVPKALAGDGPFLLVLTRFNKGGYTDYALEIVPAGEPESEAIWRDEGLRPQEAGGIPIFALALPRGVLSPGRYALRLLGLGGERPDLLAEYQIEIVGG